MPKKKEVRATARVATGRREFDTRREISDFQKRDTAPRALAHLSHTRRRRDGVRRGATRSAKIRFVVGRSRRGRLMVADVAGGAIVEIGHHHHGWDAVE